MTTGGGTGVAIDPTEELRTWEKEKNVEFPPPENDSLPEGLGVRTG